MYEWRENAKLKNGKYTRGEYKCTLCVFVSAYAGVLIIG